MLSLLLLHVNELLLLLRRIRRGMRLNVLLLLLLFWDDRRQSPTKHRLVRITHCRRLIACYECKRTTLIIFKAF